MSHIIEINNFNFSYPGKEEAFLSDINLKIEEGSFNVLCGCSGCGKSTLLRQLKKEIAPFGKKTGEILYFGKPIEDVDDRVSSAEIGFVLQNPENQIVTDKVWHELAFGLESLGYDSDVIRLRVAEMASYFGIQNWFMNDVSDLSGGQKQLLNLASIMAMHPKLIILDEPTSMLDPIAASDFLETVEKINRDIGTTVIITEHRLQDVIPHANNVMVMDKGRIIASGSSEEIGKSLKSMHHDMFLSMPIPMQIYAEVKNDLKCPLTVGEGRKWVTNLLKDKDIKQVDENAVVNNIKSKDSKGTEYALEVKDVWFRYTKDGADIVKDLNLKVKKGEFFAIVGGNGTGKSSALSLLSRVNIPYRGEIKYFGKNLKKYSDTELYRSCIGVLPQNPQSMFLKKTVKEDLYSMIGGQTEQKNADYTAAMSKEAAIEGICKLARLENLLDRHPYDLSGGEQQRLALAKVLLLRPKILLMDEPTKGIDGGYKAVFGEIINDLKANGITIIMISHDVEFVAEYADRTGLFFNGNIVTYGPSHLFFAGNSFYTTAANRMARHYFPEAVTGKEVISCLNQIL